MLKCGSFGGGFIQVGKQYYGCANMRNKGTCGNRLTISREDLESRVMSGLKGQLLQPDLIAEFVRAYLEEFNRLFSSIIQTRKKAERESTKVNSQVERVIDAIADGMFHSSMKDKMTRLETRKAEIESELSNTNEPPCPFAPALGGSVPRTVGKPNRRIEWSSGGR